MRTNLFRSILAVCAVLVVAGPGLVLAGGEPGYTPKFLQILGPSNVPVGTTAEYSARVVFTDDSEATFTGDPVTFSAVRGSFSGNVYTAPGTTGRDRITGTYTNNGVTVTGTKFITNSP
jgi:hypothetical protein